jgi:RimK family alpha-L-glutamate ligase
MIKAWLVVNAFLNTNKFTEINQWLVRAAKNKEIDLEIKTNAELLYTLNGISDGGILDKGTCKGTFITSEKKNEIERPDFVLFWDKDIPLARYLEQMGLAVFNSSKAIEICDDKSYTHLILNKAGIPMPKTVISPMTYGNIGYNNYEFIDRIKTIFSFPFIIKECFGSFGQQVYLIHNEEELMQSVLKIGAKPMLFQEFIDTSFARDIRLQVVGYKVITSMYRYSDNGDFRANITNGGKMKMYEPSEKEIELAIAACKAIKLDFAGVDILFGPDNQPLVCEVNSNAHFKNIYECTKVDAAEAILDDILQKISNKVSL